MVELPCLGFGYRCTWAKYCSGLKPVNNLPIIIIMARHNTEVEVLGIPSALFDEPMCIACLQFTICDITTKLYRYLLAVS